MVLVSDVGDYTGLDNPSMAISNDGLLGNSKFRGGFCLNPSGYGATVREGYCLHSLLACPLQSM